MSQGRVRVGGVHSTGEFVRVGVGPELLVTGRDLSTEIAGLLMSLQPRVDVRYLGRGELLAALTGAAPQPVATPELVFAAFAQLDAANLAWVRRVVTGARLPLITVVPAHAAQRSSLRARAREVGALDCLLEGELSTPLLEAAVTHARSYRHQHHQLVELRERFSVAIRGARDGMWEWDLVHERVYYSQRWRELLDLSNTEVPTSLDAWLERVHPQDLTGLRAKLDAAAAGDVNVLESEHRLRDGHGQWRWVLTRALVHRQPDGKVRRMAGSLTDITPYRRRELALREQARQDALTKLPDRRVFLERCARAVELGHSHDDYQFVVLLVALDRLAQIRDSYGITVADQIFAHMARRLRACLRPEDQLFRFSSGKLAVLLEDVEGPGFGTHIANRIHEAAAEPFEIEGKLTYTSVSIGMTSSAHGYTRVEDVISDASAATDAAREGGNRHEIYDTSMRIESRTLLALEMALRRAIDAHEFELHFQPLVAASDGAIVGFESLLRWQHPERGRISPAEFIPIAEDTGLIIPIGRWVIRTAIQSLRRWQLEFDCDELVVSVNLSAKQVADEHLLDTIDAALAETGLSPACLKLELTESVMMERVDEVSALLEAIRERQIQVWIDDFGTGYSSLAYLHRFPVDGLKIDRSFVRALDGTPESARIIRTIASLAQNFGLDVIAEGIETEDHAEQLRALGCPVFQGWLFGRAQPDAAIRELLAGR